MNVVIQVLTLIAQIAGSTTEANTIASIIATLEQIITIAVKEVQAIYPYIKNIIASLKSNGAVTADQMVQLQALDVASDTAFEQAAKDAGASPDPNSP